MEIQNKIANAQAENLHSFLLKLYEHTKHDYTRMSLSTEAKDSNVHNHTNVVKTILKSNLIDTSGGTIKRSYKWVGEKPTMETAYDIVRQIRLDNSKKSINKLTSKMMDDKIKSMRLLPLIGADGKQVKRAVDPGTMARKKRYMSILSEIYKEKDSVINPRALAKKYDVDEDKFFGKLIENKIIKPSEIVPGQYLWTGDAPSDKMVASLFYAPRKTYKSLDKIKDVLSFLDFLYDSHQNGELKNVNISNSLKQFKQNFPILIAIKKLNVIKQIATENKRPIYAYIGRKPDLSLAQDVRNFVLDYYQKSLQRAKANKAKKQSKNDDTHTPLNNASTKQKSVRKETLKESSIFDAFAEKYKDSEFGNKLMEQYNANMMILKESKKSIKAIETVMEMYL